MNLRHNLINMVKFIIVFSLGMGFFWGVSKVESYRKKDLVYMVTGSKVYYPRPDCERIKNLNPIGVTKYEAEVMGLVPTKTCKD